MYHLPESVTSKFALVALKVRVNSPTILFVGGVVGTVGSVVLASTATLKLDDLVTNTQDDLAKIKAYEHEDYSDTDRVRDKTIVLTRAAVDITKLYGPSFVLLGASIAMLAGSHNILNKRNAALTAAYAALDKAYKEYRDRVREDLGDEADRKFLHGVKREKVTETDEHGKKTQVEKDVPSTTNGKGYARLFNEYNPNYSPLPEYNFMFLRTAQNMANDKLRSKGYLFLNDVLDILGMERIPDGQLVGWMADAERFGGDGFVDFGIFDEQDSLRIHEFIMNRENELLLDFNVDGPILKKF
jgi:hypothetical protein